MTKKLALANGLVKEKKTKQNKKKQKLKKTKKNIYIY